jgi:hypothetical protein
MRVQLELPKERLEAIDREIAALAITTRRDYVDQALTLFEWALEESKCGRKIASIDPSGEASTLVMPVLRMPAQ